MSQNIPYKKEFEQIVLTGNVDDALKSLVPNSKEQLYVKFIEELKSCKNNSKISEELNTIIKNIDQLTRDRELVRECELKKNLIEFDFPSTNEKRKKEIIDDLGKQYHGLNFNHRPPDFATKLNKKEENIIVSHMYPFGKIKPNCKESWLVNCVDTSVAIYECARFKLKECLALTCVVIINFIKLG
jgi:hypothetical protein